MTRELELMLGVDLAGENAPNRLAIFLNDFVKVLHSPNLRVFQFHPLASKKGDNYRRLISLGSHEVPLDVFSQSDWGPKVSLYDAVRKDRFFSFELNYGRIVPVEILPDNLLPGNYLLMELHNGNSHKSYHILYLDEGLQEFAFSGGPKYKKQ